MNTSLFLQPAQPSSYPHSSSAPILPRQLQPSGANLIKASYVISTFLFYNILVNINYHISKIKPPTRVNQVFLRNSVPIPGRRDGVQVFSELIFRNQLHKQNYIPLSFSKAYFLGIYDPAKGFFLQRLLIKSKKSVSSFHKNLFDYCSI